MEDQIIKLSKKELKDMLTEASKLGAQQAVVEMTEAFFQGVGKTVVKRILTTIGLLVVGAYAGVKVSSKGLL